MKNSRVEAVRKMTKDELLEAAEGCGAEKGEDHCWRCLAWSLYCDWDKNHPVVATFVPTPEPYDAARAARYIIVPTLMRHGVWLSEETADALWEALQPVVEKVVYNSAPVG